MPRVEAAQLQASLEAALAGEAVSLRSFLKRHSNLPGPRGNLELAGVFADLVGRRAAGEQGDAARQVAAALASVGPDEAPAGDPGEFLAFCGVLAMSGFCDQAAHRQEVWRVIQGAAEDQRWRLREAAAQAIQRALTRDRAGSLAVLGEWARRAGWLAQRAVVAGVADPPLLRDTWLAAAALGLHEVVLERFIGAADRRDPAWRVLRQGLGYSLSVVVATMAAEGFALLCRPAAPGGPGPGPGAALQPGQIAPRPAPRRPGAGGAPAAGEGLRRPFNRRAAALPGAAPRLPARAAAPCPRKSGAGSPGTRCTWAP